MAQDNEYFIADLPNHIKNSYSLDGGENYEDDDYEEYEDFISFVKENLPYCFGVDIIVNNLKEHIFNIAQNLSFREKIMEEMIRDKLIEDTNRYLFLDLIKNNTHFVVEIHLNMNSPWKLVISYDTNAQTFHITKMVTQQYIDDFDQLE